MWRALVIWLLCSGAASADVAKRVEVAFRGWLTEQGTTGALSLRDDMGEVLSLGDPGPQEMASLAKAVTGVCIAQLVGEGLIGWDDTADSLLGQGPAATIADLMTHSSGLWPDQTQTDMPGWLDQPGDRGPEILGAIAARNGTVPTAGHFAYNNENYAVLGQVIKEVAGGPFLVACAPRALAPASARAELSPRTGGFGPMGGLRMSVSDYAVFHRHWFGGARLPETPKADVGGGAQYGPGTFERAFGSGRNFWHFGLLCFPGRLNAGSYAATWEAGYTVAVSFEGCHSWKALFALDGALARAVYGG